MNNYNPRGTTMQDKSEAHRMQREDVIHRYETFRRTGHFPLCQSRGCDETGCAAARLVSRWERPRQCG